MDPVDKTIDAIAAAQQLVRDLEVFSNIAPDTPESVAEIDRWCGVLHHLEGCVRSAHQIALDS